MRNAKQSCSRILHVSDCFVRNRIQFTTYIICLQGMKKYLKLRKHTFKNIDKFFQSPMDKPAFDKGLVLPDKLICLLKTCVSNTRGSPRGMLIPSPWGRDKIANAPPPGRKQMPRGCPRGAVGTAGIDGCITPQSLKEQSVAGFPEVTIHFREVWWSHGQSDCL